MIALARAVISRLLVSEPGFPGILPMQQQAGDAR